MLAELEQAVLLATLRLDGVGYGLSIRDEIARATGRDLAIGTIHKTLTRLEAKELVAEAGWDPTYGARPLKRALQRLVENPLALRLLEGDFAEGDTVRVDARDGELVFEKAAAPVAAAVA